MVCISAHGCSQLQCIAVLLWHYFWLRFLALTWLFCEIICGIMAVCCIISFVHCKINKNDTIYFT